MTMRTAILMAFQLLGGLALFIFAIRLMPCAGGCTSPRGAA